MPFRVKITIIVGVHVRDGFVYFSRYFARVLPRCSTHRTRSALTLLSFLTLVSHACSASPMSVPTRQPSQRDRSKPSKAARARIASLNVLAFCSVARCV